MPLRRNTLRDLFFGRPAARRPRRAVPSYEGLETRVTPAHTGIAHHAVAHLHAAAVHSSHTNHAASTASTATSTTTGTASTTNAALTAAEQTLHNDEQTIELASGTTVGELTAIHAGFQTLTTDGLTASSQSALESFENSLVTANANGTVLAGNATLLSQFEALYTSSPTTQQTTDLTTAYNALASAVSSSNITAAQITTINTDWSAVIAAGGAATGSTYPYFNLVTGHGGHGPGGGCPGGPPP